MGLFNDIDPIFFYHKSVKPLLAMGFNGVVTPSGKAVQVIVPLMSGMQRLLLFCVGVPTIWAAGFASDLLDAGVDIVTVQKLAGHPSPVTTASVRSPGRRNETTSPAALRVLILRVESSSQIFLSQPIHPNQAILYILKNGGS